MSALRDIWRTIDPQTWFPPSHASREVAIRKQDKWRTLKKHGLEIARAKIAALERKGKRPPAGLVNFARQNV